jgi:trans-aconitate 2-methyltransferase
VGWSPEVYGRFLGPRTRPAVDLCARIPVTAPRVVVDLGCGPGNSTAVLQARFPSARLVAIDPDPAMVATARAALPDEVEVIVGDARGFSAPGGGDAGRAVDVLFSNAALHWVDDHASLFPALCTKVAPGGVLAVQMPKNFDAPSHTLLQETAREPAFRAALDGVLRPAPVADVDDYLGWLPPGHVDVWETTYHHILDGDDAVLAWVSGSALVPVKAALTPDAFAAFTAVYGARLRAAYPRRADGTTHFPFRRLFLVWTAPG